MTSLNFFRLVFLVPAVLLTAACSDATDTDEDGPGTIKTNPNFLQLAPDAPAPAATSVSFWAKKGEDRRGEINFAAAPGALDTAEFVKFRVREGSLLARPDGTPFAMGDSIQITITVEDAQNMIFRFEPSGLRFSSSDPARLDLYYGKADHDFDDDGSIDDDDFLIEATKLAIWKQETPGGPWTKLGVIRDVEIDEIEANITSFTGYAIAF